MSSMLDRAVTKVRTREHRQETVQITLRFPTDLHEQLRRAAAVNAVSLNGLIVGCLRQAVIDEGERG